MSLSIVIPCYNEASRSGVSLSERIYFLCNYLYSTFEDFEVVLVSDGSKDDTERVIKRLSDEIKNIVSECYKENRGKGYAIKRGVYLATKDIILIMDADLSTNIEYIKTFYNILKEFEDVDSVVGIRNYTYNSSARCLLSSLSHFCMKHILKLNIKDTQCGFKMIRSPILKSFSLKYQTCDNWLFDAELLVFLRENNYNVRSEGVDWVNNEDSRVHIFSGALSSCLELFRIFRSRKHYKEV